MERKKKKSSREYNAALTSKKVQILLSKISKDKKDLIKDAKKLIDLSHKVLMFLDIPRPELFNALMPLLSYDKYEVEYEFVDTQ